MAYSGEMVDEGLVDKILIQGQKLRNSMVESILKNDPLNSQIIFNQHYNTPAGSSVNLYNMKNINDYPKMDNRKIDAFLKGDFMTKDDEFLALETLRSMSASDLCKTTSRTYCSSQTKCNCLTCKAYNSNDLNCDLRRSNLTKSTEFKASEDKSSNVITKQIQEQYRSENLEYLKYVDSVKISVHNLVLFEAGNKKVTSFMDEKSKVPLNVDQTYFLEYRVPDLLTRNVAKSKSKVDCGLDNSNVVRICSRRRYNEAISFKQTSIHDLSNLDTLNLSNVNIKFQISYRNSKHKTNILGYALFNFSSFEVSKHLTCHRGLVVNLNENTPIDLGVLKVSLQLGCGRLYFGKEFLDAINLNKRDSVIFDSDDSICQSNLDNDIPLNTVRLEEKSQNHVIEQKKTSFAGLSKPKTKPSEAKVTQNSSKLPEGTDTHKGLYSNLARSVNSAYFGNKQLLNNKQISSHINEKVSEEKQILFGFVYISEAQYLSQPVNSYLTCRPFCQDNNSCSRVIANSSSPIFNFCQVTPLIFDDEFLLQLRENFMLVKFWKKINNRDVLIGTTQIPLHQFYLAYRNPVILKYLEKNKLPIIGTDWWEPIFTPIDEEAVGQVQVLIALGTEEQIKNLESERGFQNNSVRSKFWSPTKPLVNLTDTIKTTTDKAVKISNRNTSSVNASKKVATIVSKNQAINTDTTYSSRKYFNRIKTADVAIQSDLEMDLKEKPTKESPAREMLGAFLDQLATQQKQKTVLVEHGTNTEVQTNDNLNETTAQDAWFKKNSETFESVEKVFSIIDSHLAQNSSLKQPTSFKVHIIIDSALHLPSRKKCKSKKSRNKSNKNDDNILPCTYVTFETATEGEMKFTQIISKNTRPKWNYRCDVMLSVDLLTNNQNRLIFKVWRKSTSAVKQPNLQSDIVLGFAALDLTVLLAGLPNVQGWFNIIDFSGKCNGQINIHVTPLEDVTKFHAHKETDITSSPEYLDNKQNQKGNPETIEEPGELLSRALKRKFSELDEITQRLRLRLSKVTNDESDNSNDEVADEFERDINTLSIEEDFNLINFAEEAKKINSKDDKNKELQIVGDELVLSLTSEECSPIGDCVSNVSLMEFVESRKSGTSEPTTTGSNQTPLESNVSALDKHLFEGKQRIDTLLEKLSLMSAEANNPFTNRYVSGCSTSNENTNIDTEAILSKLDHSSRPNIQSGHAYDPIMFQRLYGTVSSSKNSSENSQAELTTNSETSLLTSFSDCRPAPDGQGTASEDKVLKKGNN